ncbi:AAA family ATPase [Olleya sp. AH-315-K02]|nr:AAA family ATPase [bacterium AH-315-P13]MBN4057911.1 AAA family ATPase [Olleya sp. AH-315-K02]
MKIAFTGAHGVGKTTLINQLKKEVAKNYNVSVTKEVPRIVCDLVNESEYFRRDNNSLEKQLLILLGQFTLEYENVNNNSLITICDRTIYDHWAYTIHLFDDKMDSNFRLSAEYFLNKHMKSDFL